MSEISIEEQLSSDFDWFCVDAAGNIGHFATAGYKLLPKSVAASAENLKLITMFFHNEINVGKGFQLDSGLPNEVPPPQCYSERYLRSFVEMAGKGLFSFDIASHLDSDSHYFRVATPIHPLKLNDLPEWVRQVVGRSNLKGVVLQNSSRIPYQDTLNM